MLSGSMPRIKDISVDEMFAKQVYEGLFIILRDNKCFYSGVSSNYSYFTEHGKEVMLKYITDMAPIILRREQEEFQKKVKEEVWLELKK